MKLLRLALLAVAALAAPSQATAQAQPSDPATINIQAQFYLGTEDRKPTTFELFHRLILFKAQIQGREVWALLDNGFDRTVIDTGFASSQGLNVTPTGGQLRSATGSLEGSIVSEATILVPGQVSLRGSFHAADLSIMSRTLGRSISLVLGKELFQDMAVVIKPSDGIFEFWPSAALSLPPEAPRLHLPKDAVELVLNNDVPHLDLMIAGKPAVITVDLGSNDAIALSEGAWAKLGLNNFATTEGQSMGAEGRPVTTRTTLVPDISIGPIQSFGVPVTAKPVLPGMGDGLLGMGYLSQFNFVIDTKARRLWLLSPVSGGSKVSNPIPDSPPR